MRRAALGRSRSRYQALKNQRDLSLAYTPGVAEPCREIAARPDEAYTYTRRKPRWPWSQRDRGARLGNIGPLAAKPVMEGKGPLQGVPPTSTSSTSGRVGRPGGHDPFL